MAQEGSAAAAAVLSTELARLAGCTRVSIGLYAGGRLRLVAMSGITDIHQNRNLARAIVAAMEEALEQRVVIVHPQPGATTSTITLAQGELARLGGHAATCAVPIRSRERLLGAVVLERQPHFDTATVALARDAALFVGPLLELKQRLEAPLASRLAASVLRGGRRDPASRPGRRVPPWAVPALVAGCLAGAALWPVTEHVVAPARVEGSDRRVVASPIDGFVKAVAARPGQAVAAGDALLVLDDRDLVLERERWRAEIAQLDKLYGDALAQDDSSAIALARARLDQARSQLALAEQRLERSHLVAPIGGVVIEGDLAQSVGMPVQRGQELMTIAPDGGYRAVVEVDEQDVDAIAIGQPARVLFAAWSGEPLPLAVERIAPVAKATGDRNVFEVEGALAGATRLRPGLQGVARIEVGRRAWGAIIAHRAARWWQRMVWRVLG